VASQDLTGIESVRVSTTAGRVDVVAEQRTDAEIRGGQADRDGATLTVTAGPGRVEVRVPEGFSVIVGTSSGRVTLRGRFDVVAAATDSGRISVGIARSVDARTVSGRVDVNHARDRCRARTVSGRVDIGETADLDADTESGSIRVRAAVGDVRARTTSGRIEIGIGGPSDISAETMNGRIVLTLARGLGADVDLTSTSNRVDNDAPAGTDCHIVARTVSGRVEVRPR
jgi:DUF4097 and DUF4098 domain-containing protein YvlB